MKQRWADAGHLGLASALTGFGAGVALPLEQALHGDIASGVVVAGSAGLAGRYTLERLPQTQYFNPLAVAALCVGGVLDASVAYFVGVYLGSLARATLG